MFLYYDTIAGMVLFELRHAPEIVESFKFGNWIIKTKRLVKIELLSWSYLKKE